MKNLIPKTDGKTLVWSPLDELLAGIAIRIQLSPMKYENAVARANALSEWIVREGSLLIGKVFISYAQGSIAIGATITSRTSLDTFDVDFVVELALPDRLSAKDVLDTLYSCIRGESGSRYFDCCERQSRCITVHYSDKMHIDITPMIRRVGTPKRESWLFNHKPEEPFKLGTKLVTNSWAFADFFRNKTKVEDRFLQEYVARVKSYEQEFIQLRDDVEHIPPQEDIPQKSIHVVALQLIKRWRNWQYRNRESRMPPSVVLSALVAESALDVPTCSLSACLVVHVEKIRNVVATAHGNNDLVSVINPTCPKDEFTDRWPESLTDQQVFLDDLEHFSSSVSLLNSDCTLKDMQTILVALFGENPAVDTVEEFARHLGQSVKDGSSGHDTKQGRILTPAILPITLNERTSAKSTRPHTFYGEES